MAILGVFDLLFVFLVRVTCTTHTKLNVLVPAVIVRLGLLF